MPQQPQQSSFRRLGGALIIACAAVALLSSCADVSAETAPLMENSQPTPTASPTPIEAGEGFRGTPADRGEVFDGTGPSTIFDPATPETLTVVLFGSGNCPPQPVSYTLGDDGKLTIYTAYVGENQACTKDMSPITYEIATPPEFDPTKGVALTSDPTGQN